MKKDQSEDLRIEEETINHMEENNFNPNSEKDCKAYCDWLDECIQNLIK